MLTKLKQLSWIKIEVARCRITQECFQGLREECGDVASPYRIVDYGLRGAMVERQYENW